MSRLPNFERVNLTEIGSAITITASGSASAAGSEKFPLFSTLSDLNYIRTLAGTSTQGYNGDGIDATTAWLNAPTDLAVDLLGNIYIADAQNNRIRKLTVSTGIITTVAGTGEATYNGDGIDATTATLNIPQGLGVGGAGNVYIADTLNNRLRKVTVSTGKITTVAGTGRAGTPVDGVLATTSDLQRPSAVAVDAEGNIFIADAANHRIRKVSGSTGLITTVAGTGVIGFDGDGMDATGAQLSFPLAVAVDLIGNIYITDTVNHRLRKVTVGTGKITSIAGTGIDGYSGDGIGATTSMLNYPKGVAVDRVGNVFIADSENYRIRKVSVDTGKITTIAGTGIAGYSGDGVDATDAQLNYVTGVAVDAVDNFYIADTSNNRIRSMTGARRTGPPSAAPTQIPTPSPTISPAVDSTPSPSTALIIDSAPSPCIAPIIDSTPSPSTAPIDDSTPSPTTSEDPAAPTCLITEKPTCLLIRKPRRPISKKTPKPSCVPRTRKPKNKRTKKPTSAPVVDEE